MHIDTHGEGEPLGDSAPGRRYLSGEMLCCLTHAGLWLLFALGLSSSRVMFARQDCGSIPVVLKTTQCFMALWEQAATGRQVDGR